MLFTACSCVATEPLPLPDYLMHDLDFRAFADTGLHRPQEVGSAELDDAQTTVLAALSPARLSRHRERITPSAQGNAEQAFASFAPALKAIHVALSRGLLHVADPAISLALWINHQRPPATWPEYESVRGGYDWMCVLNFLFFRHTL